MSLCFYSQLKAKSNQPTTVLINDQKPNLENKSNKDKYNLSNSRKK